MNSERTPSSTPLTYLTLAALGVVFGDIGTSPLYAFKQCLNAVGSTALAPSQILGILSLIFWSLLLVVCVMYLGFILRADHDGEGGTLALLGLSWSRQPEARTQLPSPLTILVLFGSALLFGDGVITPSISVLSAVEGLDVATKAAHPFILPLSVAILLGLFLLQPRGTGWLGTLFGPMMVLWFLTIGALGLVGIVQQPVVLRALNPWYAVHFLFSLGWLGWGVIGAIVLCFSGVEALFADLGHFGRPPIQLAWYALVFPCLILNYFGQGAQVLAHPEAMRSPFYALAPSWAVYPLLAISTIATVIASQALISGVFSLTEQAVHMGLCPRLVIQHTSPSQKGQIYVPLINIGLCAACIAIILGFQSSDNLGAAYGLAVTGTMVITAITYFVVLREVWKWPFSLATTIISGFLLIDLTFFAGSMTKLFSGAWVPLLIGVVITAILSIWITGRAFYFKELSALAMSIENFSSLLTQKEKIEGTGVLLTADPEGVPLVGKHPWLLKSLCHEQVILLTVSDARIPFVANESQIRAESLGTGLTRVKASFGFMQIPDVHQIFQRYQELNPSMDLDKLVYYLPQASIRIHGNVVQQIFQRIYLFLARNALSPVDYFGIPANQAIYVGCELRL